MARDRARSERLTSEGVSRMQAAAKRYRVNDTKQSGLCVLVHPTGAKTFSVRYVTADGKNSDKSLGTYPTISVEQARRMAAEVRSNVLAHKIDPVEQARAERSQGKQKRERTLSALIEVYLAQVEREARKAPSTLAKERHHLRQNVMPLVGKTPVQNIRRRDSRELLHQIAEASAKQPTGRGGRAAANDCLKYLKLVFDFAVDDLEWIETNPATGLRKLEAAQARGREATNEELKALWNLWEARLKDGRVPDWAGSAALQFLTLTLQRGEEVASVRWSEFDLEAKRWNIPAGRKKERHEAVVPLSEPALEILLEARRKSPDAEGPFPGRANETIRRDSLTQLFSRDCEALGIEGLTMHDLRRTGRTAITDPERLGFPPHVGEAVLSHAVGNALTRTYDKNNYLPEKRRALDAWGEEVLRVSGKSPQRAQDANIVRLRRES